MISGGKKRSCKMLMGIYLGVWMFSVLVFWGFARGSDAMAYSILFLWLLLPITTFLISWLAGAGEHRGRWKWCLPAVFGVLYMLAEYTTFSLANMLSFGKINRPSVWMLLAGGIISSAGLGIGTLIRRKNKG